MPRYRFNLRSDEEKGATQLNGLYLICDEGDFPTVQSNLELLFSARVVTVNEEYFRNYALPYPDGTPRSARCVLRSDEGGIYTTHIPTVADGVTVDAVSGLFVGTGLTIPDSGETITSADVRFFVPAASV